MEKLQLRFTTLMQEKVDLKERVEELEHRCIQLSGETDTIGEGGGPTVTRFKVDRYDPAALQLTQLIHHSIRSFTNQHSWCWGQSGSETVQKIQFRF